MANIYTKTLKALKKHNAQPEDLIRQAEEVYQIALLDGVQTDKVAGRESVTLTERQPAVAVQALQAKLAVVKFCEEMLMKQGEVDVAPMDINIRVVNG